MQGDPFMLLVGDSETVLSVIPDNSIDSIVTDPPYHLTNNSGGPAKGTDNPYSRARAGASTTGFMGQAWDGGNVAFRPDVWRECLRVLKPGGYLLSFSGARTYHRLACAIEDAGFEIRDQLLWLYGSGFPKSRDVSKVIDSLLGAQREGYG
jgi:site-specific DNA-methyltransferase (adenine-specific)